MTAPDLLRYYGHRLLKSLQLCEIPVEYSWGYNTVTLIRHARVCACVCGLQFSMWCVHVCGVCMWCVHVWCVCVCLSVCLCMHVCLYICVCICSLSTDCSYRAAVPIPTAVGWTTVVSCRSLSLPTQVCRLWCSCRGV